MPTSVGTVGGQLNQLAVALLLGDQGFIGLGIYLIILVAAFLRVRPETSSGITRFSKHEAD